MANLLKDKILKFKLKNCCWLAPVRYGLLLLAYFNLAISMASLLCTVKDSFPTPLNQVQKEVLDDQSNSVIACTFAYTVEEAINVALIIGIHRRDLTILNLYMVIGGCVVILILFLYISVIIKVSVVTSLVLLIELLYCCYILLLVRTEIVNIKELKKQESEIVKKEEDRDEEQGEMKISHAEEENRTNQKSVSGQMSKIFQCWNRNKSTEPV